MSSRPADQVGVLVVRAWLEGPDRRFIARITRTADIASQPVTVTVVGSAEGVSNLVRGWLEELRGPGSP